jgi:hypothetical protein
VRQPDIYSTISPIFSFVSSRWTARQRLVPWTSICIQPWQALTTYTLINYWKHLLIVSQITASCLWLIAIANGAGGAIASPVVARNETTKRVVTFADVLSGNFAVARTSLQWTSQGDNGTYINTDTQTGNLIFSSIIIGNSTLFDSAGDLDAAAKDCYDYVIQPSGFVAS